MSRDPARELREAIDNTCCTTLDRLIKYADDIRAVLDELDQLRAAATPVKVRGVDFACEQCGGLHGSKLENGWYRCKGCGYPGQ